MLAAPPDRSCSLSPDGRANPRRRRRARRPGDAALRLPAPRPPPRARRGPPRGARRAALRRREDGAPRPARPRLVEGGRGPARAGDATRLGRAAIVCARRRTASPLAPLTGGTCVRNARVVTNAPTNVLVTGGSRGIGRAIALRFARDGARRVAIGYLRNDAAAEATAEELRAAGAEPVLVRGNVTSERVLEAVRELGPLDVLVHNAATGVIRPALETEDKHWDWTLNANARVLLSLTRVAAPSMPAGSSIVAISSLGAQRVLENYVLVGTSKAALESLVRYLAVELAPSGIRVNAVSGGVVETGALEHFPNREEMLRAGASNPVGRLVSPEDIAGAVAFLCGPDADMVRGQTLIVDGGFSLLA